MPEVPLELDQDIAKESNLALHSAERRKGGQGFMLALVAFR